GADAPGTTDTSLACRAAGARAPARARGATRSGRRTRRVRARPAPDRGSSRIHRGTAAAAHGRPACAYAQEHETSGTDKACDPSIEGSSWSERGYPVRGMPAANRLFKPVEPLVRGASGEVRPGHAARVPPHEAVGRDEGRDALQERTFLVVYGRRLH